MQRLLGRTHVLPVLLGFVLVLVSSSALAQYQSTLLVSDLSGKAKHQDPLLKNAWGLAYAPGEAFWVSDEASGWSTLYDGKGIPQSFASSYSSLQWYRTRHRPPGSSTTVRRNSRSIAGRRPSCLPPWMGPSSGWSDFDPSTALIGVSSPGASYTGLAITSNASGNSLFAADAANNKVDIYDGNFNLDSVFYRSRHSGRLRTLRNSGHRRTGLRFVRRPPRAARAATLTSSTEDGTFVKHFAHGKPLNQPWGFAVAPADFGPFSGTLLISNNISAGTIDGYNLTTGKLVGTMMNTAGKPLTINGLWGIEFGGGSSANGQKNQLFFTAGPNDTDGYFGAIVYKKP